MYSVPKQPWHGQWHAPPEARSEGRVNIHEYHGSFAICRDPWTDDVVPSSLLSLGDSESHLATPIIARVKQWS